MTGKPLLSPLVAGLWRLDRWNLVGRDLASWMRSVLELGLFTFDLAEVYGRYTCHKRVGEALRADPGLRAQMSLVTKFGIEVPCPARPSAREHHYDTSPGRLRASVEAALAELGTDHLDCLLIHRLDPLLDASALAEACRAELDAGRVLRFGVSNFTPSAARMMARWLPGGLATNQVEISPLCVEALRDGTSDLAQELSFPLMAWSPLSGGRLLTGEEERTLAVRSALEEVGLEHGMGVDETAFAFLATHPARVHPITGTQRLDRIAAALRGTRTTLDRESWFRIWKAGTGTKLP